jgi:VanZ family protein
LGSAASFWRRPNFLYYWLPPLLWCLAILIMSGDIASYKNTRYWLYCLVSWFTTVQLGELTRVNAILRKIGHGLSYGISYFLWFRAFRAHMGLSPGRACLSSLGLCLSVAVTDEGHQCFTASRGGCIADVLLDLAGAGLVALLTFAFWTPHPKAAQVSGVTGRQTRR